MKQTFLLIEHNQHNQNQQTRRANNIAAAAAAAKTKTHFKVTNKLPVFNHWLSNRRTEFTATIIFFVQKYIYSIISGETNTESPCFLNKGQSVTYENL